MTDQTIQKHAGKDRRITHALRPWTRTMATIILHDALISIQPVGRRITVPAAIIRPIAPVLDVLLPLECQPEKPFIGEPPIRTRSIVMGQAQRLFHDLIEGEIVGLLSTLPAIVKATVGRILPIPAGFNITALDTSMMAYLSHRPDTLTPWSDHADQAIAVASGSIPVPDSEATIKHALTLVPEP